MRVFLRRRHSLRVSYLLIALLVLLGGAAGTPSVSHAQAPTPTPAPSPAPTPAPTPAPVPSPTPPPRPTPTPTPAPPPRVLAIEVVGNRHIPTEQILAVITLKVGDILTPEQLRRDGEAVAGLGWFADVSLRVESDPAGVRVVFLLVENPVITEVVVEGNTVIGTPEILRALNIPIGQVLNSKQTREGVRAVEKLYEDKGYVLARVIDISLEPAGDGRLRVRVAEGRVEDIVFQGLTKTRPATARRYVLMKKGDVFNIQRMNVDLRALFETGLFENVQARPRPGSTPDTVIIEIEVKEAQTGQLGLGIGYSTTLGILGQVEYTERNWQGKAQTLSLRTERGFGQGPQGQSTKFSFILTFRDPFLDAQRTSMDINLFQASTVQLEVIAGTPSARFELDQIGGFIELGRPIDPRTVISLRLRSVLSTITALPIDPNDTCPPDPCNPPTNFTPGRTVSLTLSGTRDGRDSRVNPTRGSKQTLSLEFALPTLGGDFNFQKYFAEWVQYVPLGGQSVIAGRIAGGLSRGSVPGQDQFILGGATTLRGVPSAQYRGTSMALANLEFRAPLGGIAKFLENFTGVVFVDAGAAWGTAQSTNGVVVDYGVGVAFASPLGVLRLDFAWGPFGTQTWLNLGHPF